MFPFIFFPFSILIPALCIVLFFRMLAQHRQRNLPMNSVRRFMQHLPGANKLNDASSAEEFEVYIYRLAAKKGGRLRTAQIVVDSGLSLSEVDRRMTAIVDNLHILMEVQDSGLIVYEFPELLP